MVAGNEKAIEEIVLIRKHNILKNSVLKLPTRTDTDIFKPLNKQEYQKNKHFRYDYIISTTERLAWFKGWEFMMDCFMLFERSVPNRFSYIIGEAEHNEDFFAQSISVKVDRLSIGYSLETRTSFLDNLLID